MNRLSVVLASCLAVLSACPQKDDAAKPADPPAKDKPAAAPEKPKIGIDLPGNDPKIVEAAKKALGCKWEDNASDPFDTACPEYKAWAEDKEICAGLKSAPTLIAMIEDPDDKVRYLGEKRLDDCLGPPPDVLSDKALIARVLAVAEKTKAQRDIGHLGVIIGDSKVGDPELFPRVKALIEAPETAQTIGTTILLRLVRSDPDNEEIWNFTRDTAKNTALSKNTQQTALEAFLKIMADKPARCDVFLDNIENPPGEDVGHAGDAVSWMSHANAHCEAQYDKMLTALEARVKAKKADSALFGQGARMICPAKGGKATPAQVKKLVAIAHKLAEDKTLKSATRSLALETVSDCDPKGKKAYLTKFAKDKDAEVKSRAEFLSKKK